MPLTGKAKTNVDKPPNQPQNLAMDYSGSKDVLALPGLKTPRVRMPTTSVGRPKRNALVAEKPLRFDVGGTIFKVAALTVFSLPDGVLAKIVRPHPT